MEYSNGMGVEIPVWIIQSKSGRCIYNRRTNKLQGSITEDCIFNDPDEAKGKLKMMDFGYVIRRKRHYRDLNNSRIW